MSIEAFFKLIGGVGLRCSSIGEALAKHLDVPFYTDRQEQRLGHRRMTAETLAGTSRVFGGTSDSRVEGPLLPKPEFKLPTGEIVQTDEYPPNGQQLTEEVWTRDHWPDSFNDVLGAIQKLPHGITGVYYHGPSMNLVLLGPLGEKVGIRSTSFGPVREVAMERIALLLRLKKAATA